MIKSDLTKLLKDIPDDAIVYIEADHGQKPEKSSTIRVTSDTELPYYGDDIYWIDISDIESETITAILIW